MADLGDIVPLEIEIRDENKQLVNAASVVLTIVLPDGTTETPVVTNESTGVYACQYEPEMYGRYLVSWVTTGPGGSFTDTFDVRNLAARSIISLADAKAHLNMTGSADDEELRQMLEAVTYAIERHRNETIPLTTYVEEYSGDPSRAVQLNHQPIQSLVSITRGLNSYNVANWTINKPAGQIYGQPLNNGDVVTYRAGYQIIPAHYVLAAKITLAHLWQTQRLPSVGPQSGFGLRGQVGETIMTPSGLGNALPPRAIELLGPRPSMIV